VNLDIMQMDSKDLLAHQYDVGEFGASVRKELRRREAIGFWKGEFVINSSNSTKERESTVGTVRVVSK
jgi:hypothetical protein